MSTRAINYLKQQGIPFAIKEYRFNKKGARAAADAIAFPLEKTIKTLVVDLAGKYVLVLMPGDRTLNLKDLARLFSCKKAKMADISTAERLTGYMVGGISPFGTKKELPVIMEESLLQFEKVAINGGKRGTMLIMDPKDIFSVTGARLLKVE